MNYLGVKKNERRGRVCKRRYGEGLKGENKGEWRFGREYKRGGRYDEGAGE